MLMLANVLRWYEYNCDGKRKEEAEGDVNYSILDGRERATRDSNVSNLILFPVSVGENFLLFTF